MNLLFEWKGTNDLEELTSAMKFLVGRARDPVDGLPYYSKFREISEFCFSHSNCWVQLDLMQWHNTKQTVVRKLIETTNGEFWKEQLHVTFGVLEKLSPRVVIVANADASKYVRKWLQGSLTIDDRSFDEHGYDELVWQKSKHRAPIFFTSQFSGGATANENLRRLKWHVKKAITMSEN